jgi:hypothetical protein
MRAANPLSRLLDIDDRQLLHDTVHNLNRFDKHQLVRFHGDGAVRGSVLVLGPAQKRAATLVLPHLRRSNDSATTAGKGPESGRRGGPDATPRPAQTTKRENVPAYTAVSAIRAAA